jgi:hypothetical protein
VARAQRQRQVEEAFSEDQRTARAQACSEGVGSAGRYHSAIELFRSGSHPASPRTVVRHRGRQGGRRCRGRRFYREYCGAPDNPSTGRGQRIEGWHRDARPRAGVGSDGGARIVLDRTLRSLAREGPPDQARRRSSGRRFEQSAPDDGGSGSGSAAAFGGAIVFEVMRANAKKRRGG